MTIDMKAFAASLAEALAKVVSGEVQAAPKRAGGDGQQRGGKRLRLEDDMEQEDLDDDGNPIDWSKTPPETKNAPWEVDDVLAGLFEQKVSEMKTGEVPPVGSSACFRTMAVHACDPSIKNKDERYICRLLTEAIKSTDSLAGDHFGIGCWEEGTAEDPHFHCVIHIHAPHRTRRFPEMRKYIQDKGHEWCFRISKPGVGGCALKNLLQYLCFYGDKRIDHVPALFNLPIPRTVVEQAAKSKMAFIRKPLHMHEAMMWISTHPKIWRMEEKAELDVYVCRLLEEQSEKDSCDYLELLRFQKFLSRVSKQEVRDCIARF